MRHLVGYLIECFLTGLAGVLLFCTLTLLTWAYWPISGWVWGALAFCALCIAIGSDAIGVCGRGPR